MKKFVCNVCGYVYDPAENGNVAFEDLPEDYTCPLCGVGKEDFSEEQTLFWPNTNIKGEYYGIKRF